MTRSSFSCPHDHCFLSERQQRNERRTYLVIGLTLVTMVVEIVAGLVFGSMALLADGWHMGSHAAALGITALAYFFSRRHETNPGFTFGTGKAQDLAGYTSALVLAVVAVIMAYESVNRLIEPVTIHFDQALVVAVVGLVVNLVSAVILKEDHADHHHAEDHDHNLRAAYLHVLADALTSILAISALLLGRVFGWSFLDPVMGIVGALVIARWSWGLLVQTGAVLLDFRANDKMEAEIRKVLDEKPGVTVDDLHVWRLGPGHFGGIVSVSATGPVTPDSVKDRLEGVGGLSHLTVEVNRKS